jgi:hypothetical protein
MLCLQTLALQYFTYYPYLRMRLQFAISAVVLLSRRCDGIPMVVLFICYKNVNQKNKQKC